jgi:two-component system, NtrC family, sensor histidine kinase PilS
MEPQRRARRVARFLIVRLAVLPFAAALVAFCGGNAGAGVGPLVAVLGTYALLVVAALAAPARMRTGRAFIIAQVGIDLAAAVAMVWLTGGVISVFCPLLIVALFNATTVATGREPLVLAGLTTVLLAATLLAHRLSDPAPVSRPVGSLELEYGAAAHLVVLGLALHVVALLGARLSRGLHRMQNVTEEIMENMAEGLVAVDAEMRILELNGEARRIFGLPPDACPVGRTFPEIFGEERLRAVREAFSLDRKRCEFVLELPDGKTVPVEARISTIPGGEGGPRCRIGLFGDLSLKKDIERAERKIHRLEELYDVAMGIAHEIRNPLASIRGCAQEVGRARDRDERERRLVDIICRESDRLDRIIEEFMSSARRGPASLRRVDLLPVIEETIVQLRNHPRLAARRIVLDPPPGPVPVAADPGRLKQVFLNLGTNAIEATGPDAGEIRFSLCYRESQPANRRRAGERSTVPGVEVTVADNGAGMKPEEQEMAFRPFFTTKESGHGLGLAIVHRIVRDHLGRIDVESAPGEGSRFRVWFPLDRVEAAEGSRAADAVREVAHV